MWAVISVARFKDLAANLESVSTTTSSFKAASNLVDSLMGVFRTHIVYIMKPSDKLLRPAHSSSTTHCMHLMCEIGKSEYVTFIVKCHGSLRMNTPRFLELSIVNLRLLSGLLSMESLLQSHSLFCLPFLVTQLDPRILELWLLR